MDEVGMCPVTENVMNRSVAPSKMSNTKRVVFLFPDDPFSIINAGLWCLLNTQVKVTYPTSFKLLSF